jgi:hypothetical protein
MCGAEHNVLFSVEVTAIQVLERLDHPFLDDFAHALCFSVHKDDSLGVVLVIHNDISPSPSTLPDTLTSLRGFSISN